ncbi:MAG: hypothetical protein ACYDBZ_19250, partial [Steroidobacteraceae bacterium]
MSRALPRGIAAMVALSACACVGPNFHRPAPPTVERYTVDPLPAATAAAEGPGGAAQRFLTDHEVP